jgi:hypothetical protein
MKQWKQWKQMEGGVSAQQEGNLGLCFAVPYLVD